MVADHLTLTLLRLNAREEWANKEAGLTLVLPQAGAAKCLLGSVSRELVVGDVLVLNGNGGKLCAGGQSGLVFGYFSVRVEHMFPLFDASEICLLQNVMGAFKGPKLYPASAPLAAECHRLLRETPASAPGQLGLDHRSQLLRVAAAILSAEFKNARDHRTLSGYVRIEDHMLQVFEKLSADEILTLSAEALAGKFHCSRRHLNRLFHQHFGFSVIGLKMEMRLLKAVSLLRDLDAKIIDVAEQSGFNHLGLFNTCFKKRFGPTPGEWRKQNAGRARPMQALAGTFPRQPVSQESQTFTNDLGNRNPPSSRTQQARKASGKLRLTIKLESKPAGTEEVLANLRAATEVALERKVCPSCS